MVRFLVYTAVLYASFAHNVFWVPDGVLAYQDGFRSGYTGPDSDLVLNRMKFAADGAPWWYPLYWWAEPGGTWYRSQFGLQGVMCGAAFRACGGNVQDFVPWVAAGVAALTAAVLGLFFADVARRITPAAGHLGVLLAAGSPILLPFATSPYWVPFLLFAPFVAAWLLLPWGFGSAGRFGVVALAVAGLTGLKALCGYEYLSAVVLAPAAAVVYHRAASGLGWRKRFLPAVVLVVADVGGAVGAMGLHVVQLGALDGSNGLAVIRERAATMTGTGTTDPKHFTVCLAPDPGFLPDSVRVPARHVLNYLWLPAVASPTSWGPLRFAVPFGVVVVAVGIAGGFARRVAPPAVRALVPAAAVGSVASASWHVLAPTHTCIHGQLNLVTYYVPFLLLAYPLVGWAVGEAVNRLTRGWVRLTGVALLACAAVVIGGNAAVVAVRQSRGLGPDAAADRVEATLRDQAAVPTQVAHLSEYRLGFHPVGLGAGTWENCRVLRDLDGNGTPTRVISGWLIGPPTAGGGPVGRVVMTRGGRVVPTEVVYERVTVVERAVGRRITCTGFRVAIPDDGPTTPTRLFVVSPDGSVRELTDSGK